MDADQISGSKFLKPLKIPLLSVPHVTIETNQTCNLRCKVCYNLYKDYVKSLQEIKNDIDLALDKRKLETITLIGGEPTLHPDLAEVIRYVKSKKLICQLLTNGVEFRKRPQLIREYKRAGLNRVLLHVDSGQPYPENELQKIIDDAFCHLQNSKIYFALSLTVYKENIRTIPLVMRLYSRYSYFDGMLATIERNMPYDALPSYGVSVNDRMYNQYEEIKSTLNINPTTFLPSNNNDNEVAWLIYFYYINSVSGYCMEASVKINRIFRFLYKKLKGKEFFAPIVPLGFYYINILVSLIFELLLNPLKIKKVIKLTKSSLGLSHLRYQYIVVQDGLYFDKKRNAVRICYHCPDATIRNGKITPVCVADVINPIGRDLPESKEYKDLYREVYSHLEQLKE